MKEELIKIRVKAYLEVIDEVNRKGKYNDSLDSLYQYKVPKWYQDAKLGIFIHYGLFTQSEFREWYPHRMYNPNEQSYIHHRETMGEQTKVGYRDYIEKFKAEKYSAKEWCMQMKKLQARYTLITAEHHDGFALYQSDFSRFNSYDMNPHIDFLDDVSNELRNTNIKFGISSHRAAHYWFHGAARKFGCEVDKIEYGDILWPAQEGDNIYRENEINKLFLEDWLARSCEIIDKYMPRIYYFDWWLEMEPFKPYVQKFLAYYYNRTLEAFGEEGVVTYKHATLPVGTAVKDIERGNYEQMQKDTWQGCTAIGRNSWSFTLSNVYKPVIEIIQQFIDLISKNGNMVLNIGPRKDGSISNQEGEILDQLANWIDVYKEAIFDTVPWLVFGEGDINCQQGKFSEKPLNYTKYDIRYTRKKNIIYAFVMNPQGETEFELKAFAKDHGVFSHHGMINSVNSVNPRIKITKTYRASACLKISIDKCKINLPIVFAIETK